MIKKYRKKPKYKLPQGIKWYRGITEEYGMIYSYIQTEECPHIYFIRPEKTLPHIGWDYERHRWVVRPAYDRGMRNFGWRKEVYSKFKKGI